VMFENKDGVWRSDLSSMRGISYCVNQECDKGDSGCCRIHISLCVEIDTLDDPRVVCVTSWLVLLNNILSIFGTIKLHSIAFTIPYSTHCIIKACKTFPLALQPTLLCQLSGEVLTFDLNILFKALRT
jgi:hypothetical protein